MKPIHSIMMKAQSDLVSPNPAWISDVVPAMDDLLATFKTLHGTSSPFIRRTAHKVIEKIELYQQRLSESSVYFIAVILDPHRKLSYFGNKGSGNVFQLRQRIELLWKDFLRPHGSTTCGELSSYLAAESTPQSQMNIIDYWCRNEHKYPMLACWARDILSIPSTSGDIERVFSRSSFVQSWANW